MVLFADADLLAQRWLAKYYSPRAAEDKQIKLLLSKLGYSLVC